MKYDAQKYFLWVLGCQMNISDGERVATILEELGFVPADREEEANLILTMACSVRQSAINRIHGRMRRWEEYKKSRPLITVLSGCVLPDDKNFFQKKFDILLDTKDINQLPSLLRGASANIVETRGEDVVHYLQVKPKYSSTFQAFLPIMSGCDKFCTYCAVPFTRGREASRPASHIVAEAEALLRKGYRQITLLGQNVNSYGIDKKGKEMTFAQLLKAVASLSGDFWIHFTSPHPRDMKDDVLEVIASNEKIAKQIHLPLQAGSTAVLKRMNRTYTQDQYLALMFHIRKMLPNLALSTDIIVGFPGETESQFEETRNVLKQAQFDMAYIAQYSPRPGTPAAKVFSNDVSDEEKKRRHYVLTEELKIYSRAYNERLVGKTIGMLIEKEKDGCYFGKTEGLKNIKIPAEREGLVGNFQDVTVTNASVWNLQGSLVSSSQPKFIPADSEKANVNVL